ncbi:hypothetical protein ACIQNU_41865 [Streptomyces sp. NPDC091292]|uniref:hypothetical protein n=1 Tax=Streptomyces sp. NPDC091292 TaxID=3365991 RepID=UPI0037FED815
MDIAGVGSTLKEPGSGAEAIVIRKASDPGLRLGPGGEALLGKRYRCASCGAEVLVSKGGGAQAECHGVPMAMAEAKRLPSSD